MTALPADVWRIVVRHLDNRGRLRLSRTSQSLRTIVAACGLAELDTAKVKIALLASHLHRPWIIQLLENTPTLVIRDRKDTANLLGIVPKSRPQELTLNIFAKEQDAIEPIATAINVEAIHTLKIFYTGKFFAPWLPLLRRVAANLTTLHLGIPKVRSFTLHGSQNMALPQLLALRHLKLDQRWEQRSRLHLETMLKGAHLITMDLGDNHDVVAIDFLRASNGTVRDLTASTWEMSFATFLPRLDALEIDCHDYLFSPPPSDPPILPEHIKSLRLLSHSTREEHDKMLITWLRHSDWLPNLAALTSFFYQGEDGKPVPPSSELEEVCRNRSIKIRFLSNKSRSL